MADDVEVQVVQPASASRLEDTAKRHTIDSHRCRKKDPARVAE